MPVSLLPSFLYYCFVAGITPGPANLTSLSTALRRGKKTALLQWRGIFTGFLIVALCSAFVLYFVGSAFTQYVHWFSYVGAAYIIFLAVHIFLDKGTEKPEGKTGGRARFAEGTFLFGLFVQLTNVKIMVFCLTALSGFVLPYDGRLGTLLAWACFLPFTGPVCNLVWLFAGSKLQSLFKRFRRPVNIIMSLSLIWCAVMMVL